MQKIIDSHVHITANGRWMDTNKDSSLQRLLNEMEFVSVKKAILIAIDGLISNDYILKICAEYNKIFLPFCSVDPASTSFKDFTDLVKDSSFIGVKIHPRLQQFSLEDEQVIRFFQKLEKIPNFLVLLDCWFSSDDDFNQIEQTLNFINLFDQLRIILAHAGGFHYNKFIHLATKDNIFLDLSYTPSILNKYDKKGFGDFFSKLKEIDTSKLIFGSDFPEISIKESFDLLSQALNNYGFSKEEQEEIFSKNIEKLIDIL